MTRSAASLRRSMAGTFSSPWHRCYAAAKLRSDPLYPAVLAELRDSPLPLLDIGCGIGLLALFLRAHGIETPVLGLDYDARKVAEAQQAAAGAGHAGIEFRRHDARDGLPAHHGNVAILDILQFFEPAEQRALLGAALERVPAGGRLVIRSCLRDRSWRFRVTVAGDLLAKLTRWMRAAPVHYPDRHTFESVLAAAGTLEIRPLWGATPFNNHLLVLRRPAAAGAG